MAAVCRIGDADVTHCSGMVRAAGSPNVFVNGRAISRQGDINTPHVLPAVPVCIGHSAAIVSGSRTVRINGLGCGRVGDPTCTAVATGSSNVFAGG